MKSIGSSKLWSDYFGQVVWPEEFRFENRFVCARNNYEIRVHPHDLKMFKEGVIRKLEFYASPSRLAGQGLVFKTVSCRVFSLRASRN